MLNVRLVGFPSGGTGQGIADAGPPLLANISLWEIHAPLPRKQGTRLGDRHTRGVKEFNPISFFAPAVRDVGGQAPPVSLSFLGFF